MRTHRFYITGHDLEHTFWLNDPVIVGQWTRVLRYRVGDQVVLFDGERADRLYRIVELEENGAKLELVTELVRQVPSKEIYLCFSLLKKDKNEWVLQKGTELGVSHFVPILSDRTEKTGWDEERARKIVIEACEQSGRSDIPRLREPAGLKEVVGEYAEHFPLYVCEQGNNPAAAALAGVDKLGLLVGPEGGWSDEERQLFTDRQLPQLELGQFTLRAETAVLVAAALAATV